jgi:hypothetical protein
VYFFTHYAVHGSGLTFCLFFMQSLDFKQIASKLQSCIAKPIEDEKRAKAVAFASRAGEGKDGVMHSKKHRVALCDEDSDNDEDENTGDIQHDRKAVAKELLEKLIKAELHAFRQDKSSLRPSEHCDVLRW